MCNSHPFRVSGPVFRVVCLQNHFRRYDEVKRIKQMLHKLLTHRSLGFFSRLLFSSANDLFILSQNICIQTNEKEKQTRIRTHMVCYFTMIHISRVNWNELEWNSHQNTRKLSVELKNYSQFGVEWRMRHHFFFNIFTADVYSITLDISREMKILRFMLRSRCFCLDVLLTSHYLSNEVNKLIYIDLNWRENK